MKIELVTTNREGADCRPVTCTRRLGQVSVANRALAVWQRERMALALQDREPQAEHRLWMYDDGWLSMGLMAALLAAKRPAAVVDQAGEILAWVGPKATVPEDLPAEQRIEADADSFRIRYPWDILRVNEILVGALAESNIAGEVSPGCTIEGQVVVGARSRLLPGVFIEGNAVIGANCKIGPNCYIRGNTAIGDNCHVGQAVEIKNSLLMNGASIGHLSYCGDSIIGEKVNFGAGTITANLRHDGSSQRSMVGQELIDTRRRKLGVVVGDGVHTGINTSFYPGRKMWPGTATRPGSIVERDITQ